MRHESLRRGALSACLVLAWTTAAHGYGTGDKGQAAAPVLKVGAGARAAGMGEAFSAVSDDVHAIYYNPAGLGFLRRVEVAGMHYSSIEGIDFEFAAMALPLLSLTDTKRDKNALGVAAFGLYSQSVGGIERRGTTETDAAVDTFDARDLVYAFSYAYAFPYTGLSLGVTGKVIDSRIENVHAGAFAADVGALYRWQRLSLGLGVRNAGGEQRFSTVSDPLPFSVFAGAAYKLDRLLLAADAVAPRDNKVFAAVGAEFTHPFSEKLRASLRGGYNSRTSRNGGMSGASFGLGVGYGHLDVDFAWVPFGDLGNTFKYSLRVKF